MQDATKRAKGDLLIEKSPDDFRRSNGTCMQMQDEEEEMMMMRVIAGWCVCERGIAREDREEGVRKREMKDGWEAGRHRTREERGRRKERRSST